MYPVLLRLHLRLKPSVLCSIPSGVLVLFLPYQIWLRTGFRACGTETRELLILTGFGCRGRLYAVASGEMSFGFRPRCICCFCLCAHTKRLIRRRLPCCVIPGRPRIDA